MSAIANITVFDGAATPVSHTLSAVDVTREKGVITANWRENSLTVPVYAQIRLSMKMEKLKSGVFKLDQRLTIPVMESILNQNAAGYTAAPKVAYENTVGIYAFNHERSDTTGRRLARQMNLNIGGDVSTSVTPVTTGPSPEMFDSFFMPN